VGAPFLQRHILTIARRDASCLLIGLICTGVTARDTRFS
jgi:hypothetical protein